MNPLQELLRQISPVNQQVKQKTKHYIDGLIKPVGSLGRLEDLASQLSSIYGHLEWPIAKKRIYVMAADHGVFDEDIAVTPKEVTRIQAINTTRHLTGVCAMAKSGNIDVQMVDVGIDCNPIDKVINLKHNQGSNNIAKGPAMTREQAELILMKSARLAMKAAKQGIGVIGVGELGIGNTTPASAIVSVLTGEPADKVVGLGANYPSGRLQHKIDVVEQAINVNGPNADDPIDVIAKVGGYDLVGMTGLMIGGAIAKIPIVLDGFLSYASALVAIRLNPLIWHYLIPSHLSAEQASSLALAHLDLVPYFNLEMRLGEGSGAALAMHLIDTAYDMVHTMGYQADDALDLPDPS